MIKRKYKNVSGIDQTLVGFGIVDAGVTIETTEEINHPAFEEVQPVKEKKNDGQ